MGKFFGVLFCVFSVFIALNFDLHVDMRNEKSHTYIVSSVKSSDSGLSTYKLSNGTIIQDITLYDVSGLYEAGDTVDIVFKVR